MGKNMIRFFLIAICAVLVSPLFSSCAEDELDGCGLTVVVKDAKNPSKKYSNATVNISKESGSVKRTGKTEANGEAYFFFDNEAILDIFVTHVSEDEMPVTRTGKSTVRLKDGEVVVKDVLIQL
ncbi:MAG: hypothetical protein U0J38_02825 [Bacteroidales bacterium]|jgi:hypothetical protein|nr:hypothetical protein [Bacteroidales bacterium]MBQ2395769.1 hypothetical protein [Bacteroidales bacterium]MED9962070.1 hypothetical protein [Bacteroidales bacterium]MEE0883497.1 hypothetical protein [Bacteroidales bacterium]MEE1301942.1 hypothetical protein [Bacteroidales bacterium]